MWIGLFSSTGGGFFLCVWEEKAGGRRALWGWEGSRTGCTGIIIAVATHTTSRQKDWLSQRKEVDIYALFVSSFQAFNQFSGLEMHISGKQRHSP